MRAATAIGTSRLWLEACAAAHNELFIHLCSVPEVMRFIGPGEPWSRAKAEDTAAEQRRHWDAHGFGWRVAIEKATGDFVGLMTLNFVGAGTIGVDAGEYEIGWWLLPSAWGRGLAREGASAMRDEAFDLLGAPSIVARIQPANGRSIAVAAAIGMTYDFGTTGRTGGSIVIYRLAG
jgi:ribosomal-protein-alanine N-acetyltransferase